MASIESTQSFPLDSDTTVADIQAWFSSQLPSSAKLSIANTIYINEAEKRTEDRLSIVAVWTIETS